MLIGERIALRVVTKADAELLHGWYADPAYWGGYYNVWPTSVDAIEEGIQKRPGNESGFYLIVDRETGEPMGTGGFYSPHAASYSAMVPDVEVWYGVHHDYRRRRVATQAACLLINHLFSTRPYERLSGFVIAGNEASSRVLELAGMRHEGTWRRMTFLHGTWTDVLLYGITRQDWGSEAVYRQGRDF
ncbi:MAG: GNAT family N-acetyltransferase [Thermomicrobiales bacterium]|nr:GNAT family N-acetyltransferase [Thermomicrobiales bacterium]